MVITNNSRRSMSKWMVNPVVEEYSLSSDWDNRWRTGGSVEEIVDEAHLSPRWVWDGLIKFAESRPERLRRLREELPE
jgi:transketolase